MPYSHSCGRFPCNERFPCALAHVAADPQKIRAYAATRAMQYQFFCQPYAVCSCKPSASRVRERPSALALYSVASARRIIASSVSSADARTAMPAL